MTDGMVKSLGVGRFLDWRTIEAAGAAGGVLICWDKRSLELLEWEEGQFSISCKFRTVENGAIWVFTGVYGPFTKEDRECLWEEFGAIRGLWGEPWCVMNDLELVDLPLQGGTFTWSGGFKIKPGPGWTGPVPFKFENMWLKWKGQRPIAELVQGMSVSGRASYRLATKLKVIKQNLKVWNKEVFGNLRAIRWLRCSRWTIGTKWKREGLTEEELSRRKEVKDDYAKWVRLEEIHWRQLSRELWLREGDRNTGGARCEEWNSRCLSTVANRRLGVKADIGGLDLNQISQQEADTLELPFTEEEVHLALMGLNGDKAPGPDGFTGAFWQFCWEFVKEEILEMFKEFHEQKAFLKSLNTTFLVLIPKKGGAEELGDFRPISLVGGLYKLLAKILDASLIANEVIDSWKKRGEKGLICKLDIEKAYNSVNWKFLMRVMQKMGFGVKWREWIWSCISTAKFSVLINGVQLAFSPALEDFGKATPYPILVHYGDGGVERLYSEGCGRGLHFRVQDSEGQGQAVNISHLLFADDAIIFCEAKKDDMTFLSWILCWFEAASRLRINLAKSEIIPVGEVEEILEMTVELGCKVGKLPSTYLGLPLGAPNKAGSVWDGVEERMRWKLALWKRQYISKGGRIALIKSTLASMPLYQMSLFRMPRVVARRLEKLQRDFLWGGGSMERKAHLVNWERVCMGKEKGGLGLRKLIPLNKALLGKWVWRFANAKEEMWKRVLWQNMGKRNLGGGLRRQMGFLGLGFGRRS
ncbi:LINE-1 reverse transcriptase-like [Vitis vinifera]|uniref:LINE-1 reverse transcriptase-like n=1 Tax=Vitis vinifera TaxID=29760 RepID=A0A438FIZ0_VITVI|nr:LINE-1 reverse transcriptase-like [Vitis vinifera]